MRGLAGRAKFEEDMGPGALRRNGALFRGQRNFWDVADAIRLRNSLAFAVPWPQMFVSDVQNALPLWHVGGDGV